MAADSHARTKMETKLPGFAWKRVVKDLRKEGFDPGFIKELRAHYQKKDRDRTLKLNILGFLNPTDHTIQVTPDAVEGAKKFVAENKAVFDEAEKRYGVPREVVSSLLWIETRHGAIRGDFNVPSVFLSLLEARNQRVQSALYREASRKRSPAAIELGPKGLREKIRSRVERKSEWAIEELRALQKLRQDKQDVFKLEGSFAGAFGIPQFIPSSFSRWSATTKPDGKADLSDPADAIMSVSNYLKQSGWGETEESKRKAIYAYNHADDYVEAILRIAAQAKN
jgi:membrane-bound lytic murein transglycosylase B